MALLVQKDHTRRHTSTCRHRDG